MEVTANITKWDLIKSASYLQPRRREYLLLPFAFLAFISILESPNFQQEWILLLTLCIVGTIIFNILVLGLWALRINIRWLGNYKFNIHEKGFRETSKSQESIYHWPWIHNMYKTGSHIIVCITDSKICTIPRRAFQTDAEFEEFFNKANDYWKEALNQ